MRTLLFIILLSGIACEHNNPAGQNDKPVIIPEITIISRYNILWYTDSLLEDLIFPSMPHCDSSFPCVTVSTGALDYSCTPLPDTIWGILEHDFFSAETLHCICDTCRVINDTSGYSIQRYRDSLNTECSKM